jgi:hypothetical protein
MEETMEKKTLAIFALMFFVVSFIVPFISALDFDDDPSIMDRQKFDEILEPVLRIYNLIKYSASAIAVIVLLTAGVTYITSGADPVRRENAKNMAMYVLIGLVVIWAAPLVVEFIVD